MTKTKAVLQYTIQLSDLLEMVASVFISKEGHGVSHHPDISSPAVKVWFTPVPIFIQRNDGVFLYLGLVTRAVMAVHCITWKDQNCKFTAF